MSEAIEAAIPACLPVSPPCKQEVTATKCNLNKRPKIPIKPSNISNL